MTLKQYPRRPSRGLVPIGEILWQVVSELVPPAREEERMRRALEEPEEREAGWWESVFEE